MRATPGWLAALLIFTGLAAGISQAQSTARLLNRKAPQFVRRDLRGQIVDLSKLRGKVVLLNFWATWCAPCQTEIPIFSAWQRKYAPRGLQVVGISMDDGETPVRKVVARLKLDYPVAMGDVRLGRLYGGVLGLPLTCLIDRNGVVRAQFQGTSDLKQIEARVKQLLNEK
jgi:peroxiredoxin